MKHEKTTDQLFRLPFVDRFISVWQRFAAHRAPDRFPGVGVVVESIQQVSGSRRLTVSPSPPDFGSPAILDW